MKKFRLGLILAMIFVIALVSLKSKAQECNDPFIPVVNAVYSWSPTDDGIGMELGLAGNESNFSLWMGVTGYWRTAQTKTFDSTYLTGAMYMKAGYRFIRIPYKLSVFATASGVMDFDRDMYPTVGLKFLIPKGTTAFVIEPMYHKFGFQVMAGANFIIR